MCTKTSCQVKNQNNTARFLWKSWENTGKPGKTEKKNWVINHGCLIKKVLFDVSPIFRQTQIWCYGKKTWMAGLRGWGFAVSGNTSCFIGSICHMHPHFPTDPSHLPKLPQKFIKTCWVMSCHCTAYAKIHHKQIAIVQRGNKQNLGVPLATIYHHLSHSNFHVFFTSKYPISTIFLHKKPQKI